MMLHFSQVSWWYHGVLFVQHGVMDTFHPVEIKQSHNNINNKFWFTTYNMNEL